MKLFKKFSWILVIAMLCTMIPTYHIKANTNETDEDGIKIGTIKIRHCRMQCLIF